MILFYLPLGWGKWIEWWTTCQMAFRNSKKTLYETPFNQSSNCHACEGRQLMIILRVNSIGSRQSLSWALRLSLGQAKVERQEWPCVVWTVLIIRTNRSEVNTGPKVKKYPVGIFRKGASWRVGQSLDKRRGNLFPFICWFFETNFQFSIF